ncbi:hypothetical protein ACFVU2_18830 [Leifsonia sp. NPDC058194]|uniref:hypothetical protein n=1 Tax=Leifsonia sp. NPDC058194 TaxID=3346374 RepID=UPI0036D996A3
MTDAAAAPQPESRADLRVSIHEDPLLPLRMVQDDISAAAQLVALSMWLGHSFIDEFDDRDDLLSSEAIDFLQVRRLHYGSPLMIDFQMVSWAASWAISATPTILAIANGIGRLRLNFANASESNARRDLAYEEAASTRSERRSREFHDQLDQIEQVIESLRPRLTDEDVRLADHFLNQARLKPDLLQKSVEGVFALSQKTVRVESLPATVGGDDNDDIDTVED